MKNVDRWLLPDGVDEVLPEQALVVERLRRELLDLYHRWGYDLVIPPMVEFTESLLSGSGSDLDLMTFRVTDQVSGRMMGIRADITPQTARANINQKRYGRIYSLRKGGFHSSFQKRGTRWRRRAVAVNHTAKGFLHHLYL